MNAFNPGTPPAEATDLVAGLQWSEPQQYESDVTGPWTEATARLGDVTLRLGRFESGVLVTAQRASATVQIHLPPDADLTPALRWGVWALAMARDIHPGGGVL